MNILPYTLFAEYAVDAKKPNQPLPLEIEFREALQAYLNIHQVPNEVGKNLSINFDYPAQDSTDLAAPIFAKVAIPENPKDPGLPFRLEVFAKNFFRNKGFSTLKSDSFSPFAHIEVVSITQPINLQKQMVSTFVKIIAAVFCLLFLFLIKSRKMRWTKKTSLKRGLLRAIRDPDVYADTLISKDFSNLRPNDHSQNDPNFDTKIIPKLATIPLHWKNFDQSGDLILKKWQKNENDRELISLCPERGSWNVAALGKSHRQGLNSAFSDLPLDDAIALLGRIPITERSLVYDRLSIQPALRRHFEKQENQNL